MSKGVGFFVGALVGIAAAILLGIPSFTSDGRGSEPPLGSMYCDMQTSYGSCDISIPGTSTIVLASALLFGAVFAAFSKSSGGSSSRAGGAVHGQQGPVGYGQVNRPEGEGLGDTEQLIRHRSVQLKAVQERVGAVAEHLKQLKKSQDPHKVLQKEAEQALLDAERELVDRSAEATRLQSYMQRLEDGISGKTKSVESMKARIQSLSEELEAVQQVIAAKKRGREFKEAVTKEKSLCSQIKQTEQGVQSQITFLEGSKRYLHAKKNEQAIAEQFVENVKKLVEEKVKGLEKVKVQEVELSIVEFEDLLEKAKQLIRDSANYMKEAEELAEKLAQDTTIPQPTRQREILTTILRATEELVEECIGHHNDAKAFVLHLEKSQTKESLAK